MGSHFLQAGLFIIHTVFGFLSLAFSLRFLLRFIRADFYNPISQFIVRLTAPVLNPMHKIIPVVNRVDINCLLLLLATHLLKYTLILLLLPQALNPMFIAFHAVADSLEQFVDIYFWAIMISVLMSWIAPYQSSPLTPILHKLTEPLLSRARALLPSVGGFDLSPIPVLMGLQVLKILIPD